MLTVTNGWLNKSICQDRITRVVNSAQLNANTGIQDESRYMGPIDSFVDYYFCGGVKKFALDVLYDLSKNSTLLNIESRKPEAEQRLDLIEQYQGEINNCQRLFDKLMPESSIEFCLKEGQSHERDLSYLTYCVFQTKVAT